MTTASERRAAGEAPFNDAGSAAWEAERFARWAFVNPIGDTIGAYAQEKIAIYIRALVVQTLLDPATWARPEGWRP